jgi:peptidyl-tRNA hydrolase, PTH2 family
MKQAIIIRKDLKMRRGKEIVQGAHAAMGIFTRFKRLEDFGTWIQEGMKKICFQVDSEKALFDLLHAAKSYNVDFYLVQDKGLTEFKEPTFTSISIGPAADEAMDLITKDLKLY